MVGCTMNGPTRDQVLKFIEEKERIELEIQELNAVLETNNVSMHDPLVDADGYPRNDIDVYRVRHARNRIICLQNDHKEIMKRIEQGLHAVHSEFLQLSGEGQAASTANNIQPMDTSTSYMNGHSLNGHLSNGHSYTNGHGHSVEAVVAGTRELRVNDRAFLKVNLVSAGSPAETAGIKVDDKILQFGSINSSNYSNLGQIADVVQHSVGRRVELRIRRADVLLNVTLVPSPWAGRGLLGCNIVPI